MAPRVDILMPTYKPRTEHLLAAIESVRAQTETDWILTICDEPTDVDTATMLQSITDDRIRYMRNERRLGIGGNWNRCLTQVTAPYVQYLFQDDLLEPQYLATALAAMESDERIGMVSMGHRYVFEGESVARDAYEEVEKARAEVAAGYHDGTETLLAWMERGLHPNVVGEPSFVLLRKSTMHVVGAFREDMQQNLDSEYWARMFIQAGWYVVPGNFGSFRVHADAASARNFERGAGVFDRLRTLHAISRILPTEHQKKAQRIIGEQTTRMTEKFLLRYGGVRLELSDRVPILFSLALHPITVLRSLWRYTRSRNRE
jgi:GT2 family glycosyltransferase